jgi:hypothetical protein
MLVVGGKNKLHGSGIYTVKVKIRSLNPPTHYGYLTNALGRAA